MNFGRTESNEVISLTLVRKITSKRLYKYQQTDVDAIINSAWIKWQEGLRKFPFLSVLMNTIKDYHRDCRKANGLDRGSFGDDAESRPVEKSYSFETRLVKTAIADLPEGELKDFAKAILKRGDKIANRRDRGSCESLRKLGYSRRKLDRLTEELKAWFEPDTTSGKVYSNGESSIWTPISYKFDHVIIKPLVRERIGYQYPMRKVPHGKNRLKSFTARTSASKPSAKAKAKRPANRITAKQVRHTETKAFNPERLNDWLDSSFHSNGTRIPE